ncbi:MAG: 4-alpha-glucanotransferase [Clostridia bacterium]|nr:4-alpha-glucanotransferase [Clostridia bacterium]
MKTRSSGVLMPLTSLPSKYGIGTLGRAAYEFADFLSAAGQSYWQVLPLGPTGLGDSPYSAFSTFAGNPILIDLELLMEDGLLTKEFVESFDWGCEASDGNPEQVNYIKVRENRRAVLRKACDTGFERDKAAVAKFVSDNHWVPDYALFMAVRRYFDEESWMDWPDEEIRLRRPEAMERYRQQLTEEINLQIYMQYLFYKQWSALREYIREKQIRMIGDLPIYVALDSADAWCEPQFFQLDEKHVPKSVAGVPPDYFSADGQLWGNPLYDWVAMRADGYGWWIRRVEGASKLFDVIRIDHFRAFASYWAVPYGAETAKTGEWRPGPGMDLLGVLSNWFYQTEFIAEDLGILTPDVDQLREDSGFPGMNILEFAFTKNADSKYLPHRCIPNSIVYTGTHDNDTVLGWIRDPEVPEEDKQVARDYLGFTADEDAPLAFIRGGMASPANLFVAQMQDWLGLPTDARMNIPGKALGNWKWRMLPGAASDELAETMYNYTKMFGRLP